MNSPNPLLDDAEVVEFSDIDKISKFAKTRIAEGCGAANGPVYLWSDNLPTQVIAENEQTIPAAPIELFAVPGIELRSDYMAYHRDHPILIPSLFPGYIPEMYEAGHVDSFNFPVVEALRTIDEPVVCVGHCNMQTYGHFLLEVLPKILLWGRFREIGLPWKLAFPSDAAYVGSIVSQFCPLDAVVFYQSGREKLRAPLGLFPSLPVSASFHLHPWYAATIWGLAAGLSRRTGQLKTPGPRLFLSRQHVTGFRTLTNEAEAFAVAADYGFELVHPQELPWTEQVAMFFGATHVIGADNSALHATMFCQPGAKIVSLGRVHGIQAAIASVFGHAIGYVMPRSGNLGDWSPGGAAQLFEIDPNELRRRLDILMA